jgi:putative acyl-CoA dehydrogenase
MSTTGPTHEVFNQAPPLAGHNLFTADNALVGAVKREGAAWALDDLSRFGELMAGAEIQAWGFQANQNAPVFRSHDRYGNRIDEVEFHPAWHELMRVSVEHRLHCLPSAQPRQGSHVARAAYLMIATQVEAGHLCPISMTHAALPVLRNHAEICSEWEGKICSNTYDRRFLPAGEKKGVLIGMAMTEKQGGSDVAANTTRAVPAGPAGPGEEYRITGHKWFCSAPMSDAFLVLAQAPGGLSCFLLPRWTPEGKRNHFFIQRLKDKLGNRSNASSEVEFEDSYAQMIGAEGRGVRTIIEMVNHTRLDCALTSAALMRQAVAQALHHARHRSTFGRRLREHRLMQNVLADLCLEAAAATMLSMRLARAFDLQSSKPSERALARIATPVAKYWICKRAPAQVAEALECLGGNGYVEESILPRLYREAPLNSIWEGSGNVICLDVRRALAREPETVEALLAEIAPEAHADIRLGAVVARIRKELADASEREGEARQLVERLALSLEAALMIRAAPPAIAEAFSASRFSSDWGRCFGTLPSGLDYEAIIEWAGGK